MYLHCIFFAASCFVLLSLSYYLYILQGNVSTDVIDQRVIPHTQIELNSKTIAELVSCNSATTLISTELER